MTKFEQSLCIISEILGCNRDQKANWFIGFGALLYLIRDHKRGVVFEQDIDVCYFGDDYESIRDTFVKFGLVPQHKIVDDRNRKILFESFTFENGIHLDMFVFVKAQGSLWHTYDFFMEHPENGIPNSYHFKNLPINMIHPLGTYRYEHAYDEYTMIPRLYGTLLDYWYPGWAVPDPNFGVSRCSKTLTLKSCGDLCQ